MCLSVDGGPEACVEGPIVAISGITPGTHVIDARIGETRTEMVFDAVPSTPPPDRYVPIFDGPAVPQTRRSVCVISNSLEDHSQNFAFAAWTTALDPARWSPQWFVPEASALDVGVAPLLRVKFVPIRAAEPLVEWRSARGNPRHPAVSMWKARHAATAASLAACDAHVYANTYDDDFVAGMVELAAALAPEATRVMELPNLYPPPDAPVDAYVAPSRFAARHASLREDTPRAVVYPAALDPRAFDTTDRRAERRDRFVVAYLGRLAPERSPGLFVRAVAELRRRGDFRPEPPIPGEVSSSSSNSSSSGRALVAVAKGDGPLRAPLERLSVAQGAHVRFEGGIPRNDVPRWLRGVDVLLQPRAAGETFGVANAEAAAAGVVVVAYRFSGAAEAAPSGLLLDSLEPADYADAVLQIDDAARARAIEGRRDVLGAFARRRLVSAYDAFLSSLLQNKSGTPATTLDVFVSPAAEYAAPLVLGALAEAAASRIIVRRRRDEARISVVGCLEGGCVDAWEPRCVEAARRFAAPLTILVCGEPWALRENGGGFATLTVGTTAFADAYLPVAATALAEIDPENPKQVLQRLLLSRTENNTATKRGGVAYLAFRCRDRRERFVAALKRRGLDVAALGACGGGDPHRDFRHHRFGPRWHQDAVDLYGPYKFVVAFENSRVPGYVTEKLLLALLAGAVPVYWGDDPTHIFNPDAFISCSSTLDDCAAEVLRLDNDHEAFEKLRSAPALAPGGFDILAASKLPRDLATALSST
ncbi:hypothetical protein CTAYLR_005848 [Chrysophaeum taylorii]|uniref:Fucosyltransferase n=1 Tax=Chrysophaeum taylorii TaxID=2483200 RepID=A0AAD7UR41_9STRA|nr:hypothetical protein CTAYLR_005848 [Chrysophaeum taylorii]